MKKDQVPRVPVVPCPHVVDDLAVLSEVEVIAMGTRPQSGMVGAVVPVHSLAPPSLADWPALREVALLRAPSRGQARPGLGALSGRQVMLLAMLEVRPDPTDPAEKAETEEAVRAMARMLGVRGVKKKNIPTTIATPPHPAAVGNTQKQRSAPQPSSSSSTVQSRGLHRRLPPPAPTFRLPPSWGSPIGGHMHVPHPRPPIPFPTMGIAPPRPGFASASIVPTCQIRLQGPATIQQQQQHHGTGVPVLPFDTQHQQQQHPSPFPAHSVLRPQLIRDPAKRARVGVGPVTTTPQRTTPCAGDGNGGILRSLLAGSSSTAPAAMCREGSASVEPGAKTCARES